MFIKTLLLLFCIMILDSKDKSSDSYKDNSTSKHFFANKFYVSTTGLYNRENLKLDNLKVDTSIFFFQPSFVDLTKLNFDNSSASVGSGGLRLGYKPFSFIDLSIGISGFKGSTKISLNYEKNSFFVGCGPGITAIPNRVCNNIADKGVLSTINSKIRGAAYSFSAVVTIPLYKRSILFLMPISYSFLQSYGVENSDAFNTTTFIHNFLVSPRLAYSFFFKKVIFTPYTGFSYNYLLGRTDISSITPDNYTYMSVDSHTLGIPIVFNIGFNVIVFNNFSLIVESSVNKNKQSFLGFISYSF